MHRYIDRALTLRIQGWAVKIVSIVTKSRKLVTL